MKLKNSKFSQIKQNDNYKAIILLLNPDGEINFGFSKKNYSV